MSNKLVLEDLHVLSGGTEVLRGVSLTMHPGEVHALMGPNGSGKSSLANALMGHPAYDVTSGSVALDGEDLLAMSPDARAKAGLFLSPQEPPTVPGVSYESFLRTSSIEVS